MRVQNRLGSEAQPNGKQRNPHEIASNHGGEKIGENKYKFDRKKDAKKAASEISGNLGSNPRTVGDQNIVIQRILINKKNQIELGPEAQWYENVR